MKTRIYIFWLTLTSALGSASFSANADFIFFGADEAKEPSWNGLYIGVNGGYAWSPSEDRFSLPTDTASGLAPGGAFGGAQIGYNWQGGLGWNRIVYGLEADMQGAAVKQTIRDTNFGDTFKSGLDWFGTFRGRIGYAPSELTFFYATGGFAFGGVNNSIRGPNPILAGSPFSFNDTATGYVFGGGAEYKFTPAWSFKFEYQYINLGKNEPTNAAGVPFSSVGGGGLAKVRDDQYSSLRIGLSYYFGSGDILPFK